MPEHQQPRPTRPALLRIPLFRLLAINLAIGACAAALPRVPRKNTTAQTSFFIRASKLARK